LLVGGQPVRIVGVVRLQEAEQTARLARVHLLAKPGIVESFVADDVDLADLRLGAFIDFEDQVDAVLVELDDLRLDARGESALAAIELEDAIDVGTNGAAGEDLPRRELDLRRDFVVLEALVPLQDDAVDDRVLANVDDEVASLGAPDRHVREQLGRVQVLEGLIERRSRVGLARREAGIGTNRFRLEALIPLDRD
jgi:hypothetical protein